MFGIDTLVENLNTAINSGTLTTDQLIQAFGAIESIEKNGVSFVNVSTELPDAVSNKGRFFYIKSENRYTFSDGIEWNILNILRKTSVNLYAWGRNIYGQLGDGTTTTNSSPVSVVGGFTDWISASAGLVHNLGIRVNGTLWAWGNNIFGRLGDGTTTSRLSPVSVVGGFADWIAASAGGFHSLGIRTNGTAWAWGYNGSGRLGDGTTTGRSSPVSIVGDFTDWIGASAGYAHSLGLRANGTLWAWGNNTNGRLGDGTITDRSSPVSVVGGFTDWINTSAGNSHSLGLRVNGTLWAWGNNAGGQLGDNTIVSKSSPVSVVGGFADWVSASASNSHNLGLRANGTLWAWGSNANGQLGDGTITNQSSPVSVVGGFTDWVSASAGGAHSLGVRG